VRQYLGVADRAVLRTFTRQRLTFDVCDRGPGDGEAVILLHGFPQTSASWDGVVPGLVGAGYRTLVPDQRGYSPRARPRGRRAYRGPELVADVLALADQAGVGRFHLVGHDWGAAVGWTLAMTHPERLRTLTVLSVPHPAAFRWAVLTSAQAARSWYFAFFQIPALPEAILGAGRWRRFQENLHRSGLPASFASRYVEHMRQPGALTAGINWYRAIRPFADARPVLVHTPTLLLWGTRDAFLHSTGMHRTARYVAGPYRLEVLEGVSHWIPEAEPDRVVALLLPHLAAPS
jgi:pimeloyl-ACP methyl ester carboxylesterase